MTESVNYTSKENTQTITVQPIIQQTVVQNLPKRQWSSSLFGCFGDCQGLLCSCFCPICYLCTIYSKAGEGFCDCLFGGLVPLRVKVRSERGIQGSICSDVLATAFCPCCSLVQVGYEVKSTPPLV